MSLLGHQAPKAQTTTWLTPPGILQALGPFDLDPCAAPEPRPWPTAKAHFALPQDGLSLPWFGRVWCNPPFGGEQDAWLRRCANHGDAIALVPAATETLRWRAWVWGAATAVCFLHGRPRFHYPTGEQAPFNAGAPLALVAYDGPNAWRLKRSGLGAVVTVSG